MFDIDIDRRGAPAGAITIGAFSERFTADLSVWDRDAYRASWTRSAAALLEHGYGRFLVSVSAPGRSAYAAWTARARPDAAMLFKTFVLPSITVDFASPQDGEELEDDFADRNKDEPKLRTYHCALADIVAFEARLRGARAS